MRKRAIKVGAKRTRSQPRRVASTATPTPTASAAATTVAQRVSETLALSPTERSAVTKALARGFAIRNKRRQRRRTGFGAGKDPSKAARKKRRLNFEIGTAAVANALVAVANGHAAAAVSAAATAVNNALGTATPDAAVTSEDSASDSDYCTSSSSDSETDSGLEEDDAVVDARVKELTPFTQGKASNR